MSGAVIRPVRAADADAIAAIYAPYVAETAITFEYDVPDAAEMAGRIARYTATHPWLIAERDGRVIGYAYGSPYRSRAAYAWVAELGVYLDRAAHGGGVGTALYAALCTALRDRGYVAAMGVMTLPNAASEALHRRCGFRDVGTQSGIGFKFGRWHDVGFWQRDLGRRGDNPVPPRAP